MVNNSQLSVEQKKAKQKRSLSQQRHDLLLEYLAAEKDRYVTAMIDIKRRIQRIEHEIDELSNRQ